MTPEHRELVERLRTRAEHYRAFGNTGDAQTDDAAARAIEALSRPVTDEMVERAARRWCGFTEGHDEDWQKYAGEMRAALLAALSPSAQAPRNPEGE